MGALEKRAQGMRDRGVSALCTWILGRSCPIKMANRQYMQVTVHLLGCLQHSASDHLVKLLAAKVVQQAALINKNTAGCKLG